MGILHQGEDDGRLGVVGVEALVFGLVVVFQQDNGVFPLDQVQILGIEVIAFALGLSQHVHGVTIGRSSLLHGIHMDGNEQVGIGFIGNDGTVFQFHKAVVAARHNHIYVLVGRLDFFAQALGNIQRDGFFIGFSVPAHASGIFSAVAGVDDHGLQTQTSHHLPDGLCRHGHGDCKKGDGKPYERKAETPYHINAVLKIVE